MKHHARRLKSHGVKAARHVHVHALSTPKKIIITSAVVLVVGVVVAQFLYPANKVAWFAELDSVAVGGLEKDQAVKQMNEAYDKAVVPVFYKDQSTEPKASPALPDIGTKVDNTQRVEQLLYPWYWRLVPSSALWYHAVANPGEPQATYEEKALDAYMAKKFGAECVIAPVNASIALKEAALEVVPSSDGGTCDYDELHGKLAAVQPSLQPAKVVVDGTTIEPEVTDEIAKQVIDQITSTVGEGVRVAVAGKEEVIPKAELLSWLTFAPEGTTLAYSFNEKASTWLNDTYAKKVAIAPGVSRVTTVDFVETSRANGPSGQAMNTAATAETISKVIRGEAATAEVKTQTVAPTVVYTRSYSPTDMGITALLKHFAESHPGTYGISFVELTGARRHANYNGGTQFTTASTYKLFVAYSALLRVERGEWSWGDQIAGGRDLTRCFDDMIVKSDNACAEAMLRKIGFSNITNEAKAVGATGTSFLGSGGIKSTAQDQAVFLSALQSGQLLSQQSSRDTFLNALRRNIFRQGIPAGASGAVANKVGFMDGLLHDSGIVYSPSGTYVLVVLSDGSSWANIAELTRQLEALRAG